MVSVLRGGRLAVAWRRGDGWHVAWLHLNAHGFVVAVDDVIRPNVPRSEWPGAHGPPRDFRFQDADGDWHAAHLAYPNHDSPHGSRWNSGQAHGPGGGGSREGQGRRRPTGQGSTHGPESPYQVSDGLPVVNLGPGTGEKVHRIEPGSTVGHDDFYVDPPAAFTLHPAQPPHDPQTGAHPKKQDLDPSADALHADPSTAHHDVSHLPERLDEAYEPQVPTTPEPETQAATPGTTSHQTGSTDGDIFGAPLPDDAVEFGHLPEQLDDGLIDEALVDSEFGSFDYLPEQATDGYGPYDAYSPYPGLAEDSPGKITEATAKDDDADDDTVQSSYPTDPFSQE